MAAWGETTLTGSTAPLHFYDSAPSSSALPVLIFLHAILGNSGGLQPVAANLVESYRVILPDARCHGGSKPATAGTFTVANMVADLVKIIDYVSPSKPVFLVGHAMGASVAARVAKDYPHLVMALVLESPPWGSFSNTGNSYLLRRGGSPERYSSSCIDLTKKFSTRLVNALSVMLNNTDEEIVALGEAKQLSPLQMGIIEAQLGFDYENCVQNLAAVMAEDCEVVDGLGMHVRLQLGEAVLPGEGLQMNLQLAVKTLATWRQGSLKVFHNASHLLHVPPTEEAWLQDVTTYFGQFGAAAAAA